MLGGKGKPLEDRIVERLLTAPATIKILTGDLSAEGTQRQRAIYKAVENLVQGGVLTKVGKVVHIDPTWTRTVRDLVAPPVAPALAPGERLIHYFTSAARLCDYWQLLLGGLAEIEQDGQVFFYHPHNFWAYLPEHRASQEAYFRHFLALKVHAHFTVGETTAADTAFKRTYQNEFLQIHLENLDGFLRTDHHAIVGDYVLTVRLPRVIASQIDILYESGRGVEDFLPEIERLFAKRTKIQLTFEHNASKARTLKKKLSLAFYFWRPA